MNGIDVSHWQGHIDWHKVTGIDFAIVKSTQGVNGLDSMAKSNAYGAKNANIKLSYYHFASLNDKNVLVDAKKEAEYFLAVLKTLPENDFPVALDIETNDIGLKPEEVYLWMKTFLETFELSGKRIGVYSYAPFLNKHLPKGHDLGKYPLFLAAYVNREPILPRGWTSYYLHQYSDSGSVPGITGRVDLDKIKQL